MNDPEHGLPAGCLSSETLRRIADGHLPASMEEAAHCAPERLSACQHRLEAIDDDLVAAGQLRRVV